MLHLWNGLSNRHLPATARSVRHSIILLLRLGLFSRPLVHGSLGGGRVDDGSGDGVRHLVAVAVLHLVAIACHLIWFAQHLIVLWACEAHQVAHEFIVGSLFISRFYVQLHLVYEVLYTN